jgi:hypothetical protein
MTESQFVGISPEAAGTQVLTAIRACDWEHLRELLARNPAAAGRIEPWQRSPQPPVVVEPPEVQQIPQLMSRYPGKYLVRYDVSDDSHVYKLEIVVDAFDGGYRVIDFWGLGL